MELTSPLLSSKDTPMFAIDATACAFRCVNPSTPHLAGSRRAPPGCCDARVLPRAWRRIAHRHLCIEARTANLANVRSGQVGSRQKGIPLKGNGEPRGSGCVASMNGRDPEILVRGTFLRGNATFFCLANRLRLAIRGAWMRSISKFLYQGTPICAIIEAHTYIRGV